MFNACSLAFIGDESLASCLITLISIEFHLSARHTILVILTLKRLSTKGLLLIKEMHFANFCHLKLCIQAIFVIEFIQFTKKLMQCYQ